MLAYVDKLTRKPASMTRADVEALRAAGFSDTDILEIVEVAAYYAYANRIADGLGIELAANRELAAPGRRDLAESGLRERANGELEASTL